jgi:hypothetical protein
VFRTDLPGRACVTLKTTPTKKSREGQKGIIGALACSPVYEARSERKEELVLGW